ncbi:MAG: rhodanese-like domain-containing protein [Candidatus Marinimicrobia bacterium]|jgi:rhodanese-related sulfurtransferase|nr:rhodanese-like domain-containing protein [Candidatus Neomarinimicrobiota bacterium]MBT3937709.1 rhodanese-like domain-containing protein [Candidatus Neomarinimicrobiota bacterium]MBT3961619.1 rhodanese-like domain-containing protein [Candidatus Neomarinimicrobiota bacterium]MBT4382932.1 rhodanese-like domain-containing protein [Candidatus Neomarinimicrobiota bacterium]MBT4637071.1 rhodanese-like domain-containing protein [Candidatus Neomarinimicrobiota bacterium]
MLTLKRLTFILFGLGLVIAFVPENTTKPYKLSAENMLTEIQFGTEMVSPDELADWLINKDPSIQLIDVRTPKDYNQFHLENALNIPISQLLAEEWVDYVDQGIKMNIFYSNGTTLSHEAWMITRQLGYENNYVLQGGLNYWTETILNPTAPSLFSADDEIAKYEFRKGASQYFGGGGVKSSASQAKSKASKPKIKRKKKKKAPQGGC